MVITMAPASLAAKKDGVILRVPEPHISNRLHIATTDTNDLMRGIHHRMPVILDLAEAEA